MSFINKTFNFKGLERIIVYQHEDIIFSSIRMILILQELNNYENRDL